MDPGSVQRGDRVMLWAVTWVYPDFEAGSYLDVVEMTEDEAGRVRNVLLHHHAHDRIQDPYVGPVARPSTYREALVAIKDGFPSRAWREREEARDG